MYEIIDLLSEVLWGINGAGSEVILPFKCLEMVSRWIWSYILYLFDSEAMDFIIKCEILMTRTPTT